MATQGQPRAGEQVESGPRARTRRAILDAAIRLWGRDPSASLGDVAAEAQVGRTTVHRYFADRESLLAAVTVDVAEQVVRAVGRSRPTDGPAPDALGRLVQEAFDLGDVLSLIFNGTVTVEDAVWADLTGDAATLIDLVERGHREGSIDRELPPVWVENVVWSSLYAAWDLLRTSDMGKPEVLRVMLRCLTRAVAAPPETP